MADGGYEATDEDMRIMDLYYAARNAGMDQSAAQAAAFQQVAQETAIPTAPTGGGYEVINIGTPDAPETVLVDPSGNFVASVDKSGYNQYSALGGSGDSGSSSLPSFTTKDLAQQNKAESGVPFGAGVGQAKGYSYELLNADGEPYQRYDPKGNLTEFVNRLTGEWTKASDVKPIGTVFDPMQGKVVTQYQYGDNKFTSTPGSGGSTFAPIMDPYSKDTGGFLGEGGLGKIATLVAAGFAPYALPYLATAGLGAAGAAGVYGGLTTVGKGLLSGKSFEDSLKDGIKSGAISAFTAGVLSGLPTDAAAGLGEEFGDIINTGASEQDIGKFLDTLKESGGQFTGDVSGAGSDMTFDELMAATGVQQPSAPIGDVSGASPFDFYDAAREIYKSYPTESNIEKLNRILEILPPGMLPPSGGTPPIGGYPPGVSRPISPGTPPGMPPGTSPDFPPGGYMPGDIGGGSSGDTETEEEKTRKREQAFNALAMQPVTVRPPPVAEIDYVYDIGGDSIFATPKQESLMPSPLEKTPEPVEGAMPRYQYYDPRGGYQYAEGGSIDDLYELLRGK